MKKYFFKVLPALANPNAPGYDIVTHRIINEKLEKMTIKIEEESLMPAVKKALDELSEIMTYNLRDMHVEKIYGFQVEVEHIEIFS